MDWDRDWGTTIGWKTDQVEKWQLTHTVKKENTEAEGVSIKKEKKNEQLLISFSIILNWSVPNSARTMQHPFNTGPKTLMFATSEEKLPGFSHSKDGSSLDECQRIIELIHTKH